MGKQKKKRISWIRLWDEFLYAKFSKTKSLLKEKKGYNIYADFAGIYSGVSNIAYLYTIDELPQELENSFVTSLRSVCKGNTRLSFISFLEKTDINWDSPQVKSKLRVWRKIDEDTDDGDAFSFAADQKDMDTNEWKKDSLYYLVDALKRRRRKLFRLRCLVVLSGERSIDFDKSCVDLETTARAMQLKLTRVFGDIPNFLETFSPFAFTNNSEIFDLCGNQSLTDEHLARLNTYAQGQVGKTGKYFGTDIFSGYPTFKLFKKTTETAENLLITAETGGGKSFLVKTIIYQLLADPQYIGTVMDVEGIEYSPMHYFMLGANEESLLINMAEGSGAYFDPVSITLTGDPDLDAGMYSLSLSFTTTLCKCLLGDLINSDDTWVEAVIMDAVQMTYTKVGVLPDIPETWHLSADLTLYDVYKNLKALKMSGNTDMPINSIGATSMWAEKQGTIIDKSKNDVTSLVMANEGYQKAIDGCIARLSRYFEPNGIRAYFFKDRVTVDQVRNAKLVICSFGMAGRAETSVDPTQMSLMQLYAANISHLRSIFGKLSGRFNFKVWEEFQRWGHFPDSEKTINVALTGGRKLGDLNFIITNKVGELLKDDKFGIFSNINSFAIGCISDAYIRKEVCERLGVEHLQPELDLLYTKNQDLSSYVEGDTLSAEGGYINPYSKGFLIGLDRTVFTLVRVQLPVELAKSDLFRTGVTVAKQEETADE